MRNLDDDFFGPLAIGHPEGAPAPWRPDRDEKLRPMDMRGKVPPNPCTVAMPCAAASRGMFRAMAAPSIWMAPKVGR